MKLFGHKIAPACTYCKRGKKSSDPKTILCKNKGIVPTEFSCRKFVYAPLKRIPQRHVALPSYKKEDFSLK